MEKENEKKYILFSPVSRVDPIYDDFDGPMLHICRKYKPEVVVLYLSSEMYKKHIKDDRYRKSIDKLADKEGFNVHIETIDRPELTEVNDYEIFFNEFRKALEYYHKNYPDHDMLLNIASGTPQMQANLYMLASFLPFPVMLIQTVTHKGKQNDFGKKEEEFIFEKKWKDNLDNEDEHEDRCNDPVKNQNLNIEIQKKNINALLDTYDYSAALEIANSMKELLNPEAISLLKAAKMRSELNTKGITKEIKEEFGINGDNQNHRLDIAEFLLWLNMKFNRFDYGDYLRAITPVLFALMKLGVEEKGNHRISEKCCDDKNRFDINKCNREKENDEFKYLISKLDIKKGKIIFLLSSHYDNAIYKNFNSRDWAEPLHMLRSVEEIVRNDLAHTITPISEEWIHDKLKNADPNKYELLLKHNIDTIKKVNKLFKQAVDALNKDMPSPKSTKLNVTWDAYDKMNELIKKALDKPYNS